MALKAVPFKKNEAWEKIHKYNGLDQPGIRGRDAIKFPQGANFVTCTAIKSDTSKTQ